MRCGSLLGCERASAAAEFALMLPMMLALMLGGMEGGNFIWNQHKLTVAVRDGARYASRLPVSSVCSGATSVASTDTIDKIKLITRTGQIPNTDAYPRVAGWTAAEVSVVFSCQAFASTGIYGDLGEAGAIVTVRAQNVPYPSLFEAMGFLTSDLQLSAKSSAPVVGI